MNNKLLSKSLVFWLLMLVCIVANGTIGEFLVKPFYGDYGNHLYKSVIGVGIILFFSRMAVRKIADTRECYLLGGLWFSLTVGFEFLAGHFLFGSSWEKLFADYKIWEGRIWILILLALLLGPRMMYKLKNKTTP